MSAARLSALHYGTANSVLNGYDRSGDLEFVHLHAGGALIAVVDGLGHGDSAAHAAEHTRLVIQARLQDPPVELLRRCHEELRFTRGVVMSVASIDFERGLLTWLGVGNVRGVLYRAQGTTEPQREELLLRPGVVGAQLPVLQATVTPVGPGDTLVFATDGVRSDFADTLTPAADPRALARQILARYGGRTDDALVLVAQLS